MEVDFTLELLKYQKVHSSSYVESDLPSTYAYKEQLSVHFLLSWFLFTLNLSPHMSFLFFLPRTNLLSMSFVQQHLISKAFNIQKYAEK